MRTDPIIDGLVDQPLAGQADFRRIAVEAVVARGDTGLTRYHIVRFSLYGLSLLIDGLIQSTAFDEGVYHEMLISPACAFHGAVTRVVILGGANGGIANRIAHLPGLRHVLHVDLDETLYRVCRYSLPHLHESPRGEFTYDLRFASPANWLRDSSEPFHGWADLVLLDLPDPTEASYAASLYSPKLLQSAARLLGEDGVLAVHAGSAHPADAHVGAEALAGLRSAFDFVELYERYIPSLGVPWRFALASQDERLSRFPDLPDTGAIDRLPPPLRAHYSNDQHRRMIVDAACFASARTPDPVLEEREVQIRAPSAPVAQSKGYVAP